jgi:hypothetical protein
MSIEVEESSLSEESIPCPSPLPVSVAGSPPWALISAASCLALSLYPIYVDEVGSTPSAHAWLALSA